MNPTTHENDWLRKLLFWRTNVPLREQDSVGGFSYFLLVLSAAILRCHSDGVDQVEVERVAEDLLMDVDVLA